MRTFVRYNHDGQVLSVSKARQMPEHVEHPFALDEGESALEVPVTSPLAALDVIQLHDGYHVDVKTKQLVKKP